MFVKSVMLWEHTPGLCEETPVLDIFLPEKQATDIAIVILPGGGYSCRSEYEGAGYAEFLNDHGIAAFVCQYRVSPHQFPLPLLDARRAIRYVRFHSKELHICKEKVYIMGSSAGGHLAALTCTYNHPIDFEKMDVIDKESYCPNGQILCYPVIELIGKSVSHLDSGKNLLGLRHAEMGEDLSPHLLADEKTPRAFIWHTFNDECVNVINSLDYAKRLRQVNADVEMHIYPYGAHGAGLAQNLVRANQWPQELLKWLFLDIQN